MHPYVVQVSPLALHQRLLKRDEARVGHVGTTTVADGLVGDGELAEVVAGHLGLDLNGGEGLAVLWGQTCSSQRMTQGRARVTLVPRWDSTSGAQLSPV